MKTKVFVFYAISFLSLSLFIFSPAASGELMDSILANFQVSSVLLDSADHMVSIKQ